MASLCPSCGQKSIIAFLRNIKKNEAWCLPTGDSPVRKICLEVAPIKVYQKYTKHNYNTILWSKDPISICIPGAVLDIICRRTNDPKEANNLIKGLRATKLTVQVNK